MDGSASGRRSGVWPASCTRAWRPLEAAVSNREKGRNGPGRSGGNENVYASDKYDASHEGGPRGTDRYVLGVRGTRLHADAQRMITRVSA